MVDYLLIRSNITSVQKNFVLEEAVVFSPFYKRKPYF
jgi:hypothetical protein